MNSIDHARAFLAMLDPAPNAIFCFRTLTKSDARNYSGTLDQCWPELCRDNEAGRDAFVVVNEGGHKRKDITRVRAVFVDNDNPEGRAWQSLYGIGRDPHMVVQSSPNKWHAYWCVHDFPLDQFKATQQAFAAKFDTDPAVCDLPRVMRLPGLLHMKCEPFLSHLVALDRERLRYSVEIAAAAPSVAAVLAPVPVDEVQVLADFHRHLRAVERAKPGDRNRILNGAAFQMGRCIPAVLEYGNCESELLKATATWADPDKVARTIKDGLTAGMGEPLIVKSLAAISGNLCNSANPVSGAVASPTSRPPAQNLGGLGGLESAVKLLRADNVTPEPINWLWRGFLAEGKFHILAGDPGCGKTTAACSLGAIITRGGQWPDKTPSPMGDVLIWSGEDDIANTLVPRIMACGGDRAKVHFIEGTTVNGESQSFDPAAHIHLLEDALAQLPNIRLLIVDPVVAAVAGDSHKNAEVRRALQPLVDLAARRGIAVLGITHFSKGTGGRNPSERVTGSLAFVALARVVMVAAVNKSDEGTTYLMVRTKSNIGPSDGGFEYQLTFPELAPGIVGSCVHWGESLDGSAREILGAAEEDENDDTSMRCEANKWLAEQLSLGPVSSKQLRSDGKESGLSWRTLERAKKDIGAKARKNADGVWEWSVSILAPGLTPPPLPVITG